MNLNYWNLNNLYGWATSQRWPAGGLKWVGNTSSEDFIKNYNKDSDEWYFLEVYFQYSEKSHAFHNDLQFLIGRMKI